MQEKMYPALTIEQVVRQIATVNEKHKYWDRRFAGRTRLANMGGSISLAKDFFSEEQIDEQFALFILAALLQFPVFYLERFPGEIGQGPIFSLMQHHEKEAATTLLKFRKDMLPPRMADEMQQFFESDCNNKKRR